VVAATVWGTTWITWVLTVFLLVASVATPILGKLSDQFGKERLLTIIISHLTRAGAMKPRPIR
jgi:MFS family permease